MSKDSTPAPRKTIDGGTLSNVVHIDDERIQDHLGKIVRGSVEDDNV